MLASVLKFMFRVMKGTKICSVARIIKIVNYSSVQKENTKQKEIIRLVDPRTLQNRVTEKCFEFWDLKMCQLHQLGIQFSRESTMSSVNIIIFYIL